MAIARALLVCLINKGNQTFTRSLQNTIDLFLIYLLIFRCFYLSDLTERGVGSPVSYFVGPDFDNPD
jgi:hypothetical protein